MTACSAANPCGKGLLEVDPLSVLDYSTCSAFLMDFGDCPLDRRTQSEIVDTMKTLAPRQTIYQQPGTPDILEVRAMLPDSDAIGEYITGTSHILARLWVPEEANPVYKACCEDPIG